MESAEGILLIVSVILIFSVFAGKAGYRFGLPALLLFLGVGMLFGSDGLGIQFDNPKLTQFIGVLALSIILFSGGMDTKVAEIKPIASQGIVLATVGVFTDYIHYRRIYLCHFDDGIEICHLEFSGIVVIGGGHVVNRFGFGFLHTAQ